MTALIYASSNDHTNVVPLLLSAGANANQQDKVCFWSVPYYVSHLFFGSFCSNFFFIFVRTK